MQFVEPITKALALGPVIDSEVTRRVSVPEFVSPLPNPEDEVPTRWFPNPMPGTVAMTGAVPLPLIGTWLMVPVTGLMTSTNAVRAPVVVGANVRRSWHEAPGARACEQPEASWAKRPGLWPCTA